jgi:hypothetical protein
MITLTHGADVCLLPDDLIWVDEFNAPTRAQNRRRTLAATEIIEETTLVAGRAITLDGGGEVWVSRATVLQLQAMTLLPAPLVLVLADGRPFDVAFDHSKPAVKAQPVLPADRYDSSAPYFLTVSLITL